MGIDITLQIDDISAQQTARICQTIESFPQETKRLSNRLTVWFSNINQNTRIIKIQAFAKTGNLKAYRAIWNEIDLGILKVMEQEKIELFSSTPIATLPVEEQIKAIADISSN